MRVRTGRFVKLRSCAEPRESQTVEVSQWAGRCEGRCCALRHHRRVLAATASRPRGRRLRGLAFRGRPSVPRFHCLQVDRPQPVTNPLVQGREDTGRLRQAEVLLPTGQIFAEFPDDLVHAPSPRAPSDAANSILHRRQGLCPPPGASPFDRDQSWRFTGEGWYVPARRSSRMRPQCSRTGMRTVLPPSSRPLPGLPLFFLTRFSAAFRFGRDSTLSISSAPSLPECPLPSPRRRGFRAPSTHWGFTPFHERELQLPGLLRHDPFEARARLTLLYVQPFAARESGSYYGLC